jgi:mono/diheme cytochrome c family protein
MTSVARGFEASAVLFMFAFLPGTVALAQTSRDVPSEASALENPFTFGDVEVIEKGRHIYEMACIVCHGERGDGDGAAGRTWSPPPTDLTSREVQDQSDGSFFWKIAEGNPPAMLQYKDILNEEEIWQLVIYLRQFAAVTCVTAAPDAR